MVCGNFNISLINWLSKFNFWTLKRRLMCVDIAKWILLSDISGMFFYIWNTSSWLRGILWIYNVSTKISFNAAFCIFLNESNLFLNLMDMLKIQRISRGMLNDKNHKEKLIEAEFRWLNLAVHHSPTNCYSVNKYENYRLGWLFWISQLLFSCKKKFDLFYWFSVTFFDYFNWFL